MNEEHPKNWKTSVEHPTEDDLLCYIDGELNASRSDGLRGHLEACWECRNRAEKYQTAISQFVDYRNLVMKPLIEAPGGWGDFSNRLKEQAAEPIPMTIWERFQGMIHRFQSVMPSFEARTLRLAGISMATVLVGVIGVYVLVTGSNTVVSAEEFISLATTARDAELKKADQPVLYQQIQVTRKVGDRSEAANVEIWQDVENLRIRKVVSSPLSTTPSAEAAATPPIQEGSSVNVVNDLEQILKANKYEPPPLSIVGFKAWRGVLANKSETVERLTTPDGVDALRLTTETASKIDQNQLIASVLTVRAGDYHPLEQVFRVLYGGEVQEYEVRESSFAVMSLNSLNPGFFNDAQPLIMADTKPQPSASSDNNSNTNADPANTNTNTATAPAPNAIATAELEVEVMNALHAAGADLGEQIEVRRAPGGPVTISGVVETPERKGQILNALGALKDNPAVRIQISTVSEALAADKSNRARPQPSVERVEVDTDSYPAEGDLLAHFGDAAKARNFAARMTGQSSRAMNYLWAMKRLKGQFGGTQVEKLTPEARAKLLNVVRSYASNYQREIGVLRRELQPVFGGGGGGSGGKIGSDAELLQTIDQLFAAGTATNQIVRTAFTTGSQSTNALRTAQFWQNVSRAEALASAIERYR